MTSPQATPSCPVRSSEWILVADDDPAITEGLAAILDRPDRTVVVCRDLEAAEIALERYPITHVVTDVQFTGDFGYEGFHFLSRLRSRSSRPRVVLITGSATPPLKTAALREGAAAVVEKPFTGSELEAALQIPGSAGTAERSGEYDVIRAPGIDEILTGEALSAVFQPIVRLTDSPAVPVGFEALTRIRSRWFDRGPAPLFQYAARRSRLEDLNLLTLRTAIQAAAELPAAADLFVNVDPVTFEHPQLVDAVEQALETARIDRRRLVLEITERSPFGRPDVALRVMDRLRCSGVRFALDDHGAAYSHLEMLGDIQPAFFKISPTFGSGFELDHAHARIVESIADLASSFGSETILEGVETEPTAAAARACGITLAQGFHFGRPAPAFSFSASPHGTASFVERSS